MTKFYFVRHGEADMTEANTRIYQGWGYNMVTLSDKGIGQIKNTAKDERLKNAKIIVTSPFGRAMHTAAILSKELGIDIRVETNLHEWIPDADYSWPLDEDTMNSYREFVEREGVKASDCKYNFETVESIRKRVDSVLEKYRDYGEVIIVSHGTLIQSFLGVDHSTNGQIMEYEF